MRPAGVRSSAAIGDLWPRCAREGCGHIAQSHNNPHKVDGEDKVVCDELVRGKCPTCGTWQEKIPCSCIAYVGPTHEEFGEDYLTEEERNYYHWDDV